VEIDYLIKKFKIICFYSVTVFISFLLAASVLNIILSIYRINHKIDHTKSYLKLKEYYNSERAEVLLEKSDNKIILTYSLSSDYNESFKKELSFTHHPDDYVIYVYGSSTIVSKPPVFSDNYYHFPDILESRLNSSPSKKDFKVYNFGVKWADSYAIKKIAESTVDFKLPDLLIYYYEGGADYELAYRTAGIKEQYYLLKSGLLKNLFAHRFFDKIPGWKTTVSYANWFLIAYVEPVLINLIQMSGLVEIKPEPFEKYNSLIYEDIKKNILDVASYAEKNNIPIIFITCLDNIKAKPFGIYKTTQKYYKSALEEKNYSKKMEYFIEAKDSEIFTGDIRAKSEVYDFFRNLPKRNFSHVYLFDLREQMFKEGFSFDYDYFYDYGHPKPHTNKIIADYLFEFIKNRNLL